MQRSNQHIVWAIAISAVTLVFALYFGLRTSEPVETTKTWKPDVEGFLAVATPCCSKASLWDDLDTVTADEQRARPATAAEAAEWLNQWPYRSPDESEMPDPEQLQLAARNSEVRCVGEPSGPDLRPDGDDEETLKGIHFRRECKFAKWTAWAGQTTERRANERHTVWVDEDGFFHGRVDYWK